MSELKSIYDESFMSSEIHGGDSSSKKRISTARSGANPETFDRLFREQEAIRKDKEALKKQYEDQERETMTFKPQKIAK